MPTRALCTCGCGCVAVWLCVSAGPHGVVVVVRSSHAGRMGGYLSAKVFPDGRARASIARMVSMSEAQARQEAERAKQQAADAAAKAAQAAAKAAAKAAKQAGTASGAKSPGGGQASDDDDHDDDNDDDNDNDDDAAHRTTTASDKTNNNNKKRTNNASGAPCPVGGVHHTMVLHPLLCLRLPPPRGLPPQKLALPPVLRGHGAPAHTRAHPPLHDVRRSRPRHGHPIATAAAAAAAAGPGTGGGRQGRAAACNSDGGVAWTPLLWLPLLLPLPLCRVTVWGVRLQLRRRFSRRLDRDGAVGHTPDARGHSVGHQPTVQ